MSKSSYRNLTIGEKKYRYVIGKKFVKIRLGDDSQLVPKEQIGIAFGPVVTPGMIKLYLVCGEKPHPKDFFDTCNCEGKKSLGYVPFDAEIHDKYHQVYWCDECFEDSRMDI